MLVLLLLAACQGAQQPADPAALLARGMALIEANCAECMNGTRAGLEKGVASVRQAMELGVADRAAAYRALADAYGQLAWGYAAADSADQKAQVERRIEAFEGLLAIEPNDQPALFEYAISLPGGPRRLAVLERLLELNPDHSEALFVVGEAHLARGDVDSGLAAMQRAFAKADGELAVALGERLLVALREHHRAADADQVAQRIKELREQLDDGREP